MIYHYFYKITNKINGDFYFGVHSTKNLNDGYMGSGRKLKSAYEHFGIENFEKQILKFFGSSDEMFEYEKLIVTSELVSNPKCYNLTEGGEGYRYGHSIPEEVRKKMSEKSKNRESKNKGKIIYHLGTTNKMVPADEVEKYEKMGWEKGIYISPESRKKLSTNGFKGKHFTDEQKQKLSDIKKEQFKNGEFIPANKGTHLTEEQKLYLSKLNTGKTHSEDAKKKMSESRKGIKHSEERKKHISEGLKGHKVSDETKEKISISNRGKKRVFPKREKYLWQLEDGRIICMDQNNAKRLYGQNIIRIE